jgi:hypothetical protein
MKDSEARIYHRQSKRFIKDKKESKDRIWMSKSNKSSCQLRIKKTTPQSSFNLPKNEAIHILQKNKISEKFCSNRLQKLPLCAGKGGRTTTRIFKVLLF